MVVAASRLKEEELRDFRTWLERQGVRPKLALVASRNVYRVFAMQQGLKTRTELRDAQRWEAYCREHGRTPALHDTAADAFRVRLLEITLALCDMPKPSRTERGLRLLARLGCGPGVLLDLQYKTFVHALETGNAEITEGSRIRVVGVDPALRKELEAVLVDGFEPDTNLAYWISGTSRVDGNGAARTKLRRVWQQRCCSADPPLVGASLLDLATALGVPGLRLRKG